MSNSELAKFTASIEAAWKDLHSFLTAVTPSQASKRDQAGWSVKDHVMHLAAAHRQLMGHLRTLRDAGLNTKAREFFPQAPSNDERPLASLIWDNTGRHFAEHLEWMRDLVGRAT